MEKLIDSKAAAELLGVKAGWLDDQRGAGKGPAFHRIGALIRYTESDLEAWVRAQRVASPVELLTVRYPAELAVDQGDQAG